MMMPLRLQQTRYAHGVGTVCDDADWAQRVANFPFANASETPSTPDELRYPRCGSQTTKATEPFGPGSEGFTYTPPPAASLPAERASLRYSYCGHHDTVTMGGTKCYGADGYMLDVWPAAEYRSRPVTG